jgi:regulatory protein
MSKPASLTRCPYDRAGLDRIAIAYVGRYATSRAKLIGYLRRKIDQHGWSEETSAPIEAIADRFVELGYIDDASFARSRAESLGRRGYGKARISASLRAAGIERDTAAAVAPDDEQAEAAALAFARRRRIGPFATSPADPDSRRRALGAMLRAGHPYDIARRILHMEASPVGTDAE